MYVWSVHPQSTRYHILDERPDMWYNRLEAKKSGPWQYAGTSCCHRVIGSRDKGYYPRLVEKGERPPTFLKPCPKIKQV